LKVNFPLHPTPTDTCTQRIVLRGMKKSQVNFALGRILSAVDIRILVDFLVVCEVILELRLLLSLLHGSRRPGPLSPLRFCLLHHIFLLIRILTSRTAFISFCYRVHAVKGPKMLFFIWSFAKLSSILLRTSHSRGSLRAFSTTSEDCSRLRQCII
jgi:hypothetical protein